MKRVAIAGGGPAGLMAAEVLSSAGIAVAVYDRMPSLGRKFLMAGRGGLNLTHSEDFERLIGRYGAAAEALRPALEAFPPAAVRAWCEDLGVPTFIGTSGRIFPKSMKASPLLRAWLRRLDAAGVTFSLRHRWTGWDGGGRPQFLGPGSNNISTDADALILALGGASWPRFGSDGGWLDILRGAGIDVAAPQPSNCGVIVTWSDIFRGKFAGKPLKRMSISLGEDVARGEAIVTDVGLEGGAVYALSAGIRTAIATHGSAELKIDLAPDATQEQLAARLAHPHGKQSFATFLRKAVHLSATSIGLLNEAAAVSGSRLAALPIKTLASLIKAVPVRATGLASIERAISTAGGIAFTGLDAHYMLRKRPGVFAAGEMLDWDAPTGGYLLQACFATGRVAANGALDWLGVSQRASAS